MTTSRVISEGLTDGEGEKGEGQNHNYSNLCEDVLVHIVRRLGVKDAHRCKCISKDWSRMISDVHVQRIPPQTVSCLYFLTARLSAFQEMKLEKFCRSYELTRPEMAEQYSSFFLNSLSDNHYVTECASLVNRQLRLLLIPRKSRKEAYVYSEELEDKEFEGTFSYLDVLPFAPEGKDFIDCCNGLLLFICAPTRQYFVCNPATKQYVSVPPLDKDCVVDRNSNGFAFSAALAYNPSISPHFKILHFHLESQPQWLDLFDSQTGCWFRSSVKVEAPTGDDDYNNNNDGKFRFFNRPVYLDGVVYMYSWYWKIYSFHINNTSNNVTVVPMDLPKTQRTAERGCLGISTGTLCHTYRLVHDLCLWLLDNPHSQPHEHRWILKYNVDFFKVSVRIANNVIHSSFGSCWLKPFAVDPNSDVIFLSSICFVFKYNFKTDTLELLYEAPSGTVVPGIFYDAFPYSRSLVPLKQAI